MKSIAIALALMFSLPSLAHETDIADDAVQVVTGPLYSPISDGVLHLGTKESATTWESESDANSIYIDSGQVTVTGGVSGMIRLITGTGANATNGYAGNIESFTGDASGEGFAGDFSVVCGQNGDGADNGGRVRLAAIRTQIERGYFRLATEPPTGVTPQEGDEYFDPADHKVHVYSQGQWKTLAFE